MDEVLDDVLDGADFSGGKILDVVLDEVLDEVLEGVLDEILGVLRGIGGQCLRT